MSGESTANGDRPFIIASECHIFGDLEHINYFPGFKLWQHGGKALARYWIGEDNPLFKRKYGGEPQRWTADKLIEDLDRAGIDMAFLLREPFMDVTLGSTSLSTNGQMAIEAAKYPDRLLVEINVGPILRRGVKNAIWELRYWVEERDIRLCKVYAPEDGPLNDPELWPFYEAAEELGVVLTVHTGLAYVQPQYSKYSHPGLLDDVCNAFPSLPIIAYHMGWPYHEELIGMCAKHPNLYMSVSGIIGWYTLSPYRGYHHIGQAIQQAGVDKIVFGLDWPGVDPVACVDYMLNLQMPEELTEKWGYRQITEEDRTKMLGLTLAELTRVKPEKKVRRDLATAEPVRT
jgi:predicted TIM-barrel fold metal-dependent hydrolase